MRRIRRAMPRSEAASRRREIMWAVAPPTPVARSWKGRIPGFIGSEAAYLSAGRFRPADVVRGMRGIGAKARIPAVGVEDFEQMRYRKSPWDDYNAAGHA